MYTLYVFILNAEYLGAQISEFLNFKLIEKDKKITHVNMLHLSLDFLSWLIQKYVNITVRLSFLLAKKINN